jgi:acetyltransferase-like isoleucine patch superfamily enzyme
MSVRGIERLVHLCGRIHCRLFSLLLSSQFKSAGPGSRISPPFRFYGLNEIVLGANVRIERDCWIQTIPGAEPAAEPKIIIGANTGIGMGASISAASRIELGEHVLLARNVYISDHSHAYEDVKKPIMLQGIRGIAPVVIGRHSWLGQNVIVLAGVTIGQHCVIGANSVVKTSIPDFSVAVGAPAKVVKRYDPAIDSWESVNRYLEASDPKT